VLPILIHGKPEDVTDEDFEAAKIHGYEYFNNQLGDKEFLTGDKPTWADFLVFSLLMQMDIHPKTDKVERPLSIENNDKFQGQHDKLKQWAKRIHALPFFPTVHKSRLKSILKIETLYF